MQGAVSNQVIKCVIFSMSKNKAVLKLEDIVNLKKSQGIEVLSYTKRRAGRNEARFSDGEEWITLPASEPERVKGYRWRKAWVDRMIPRDIIENYINPIGNLYKVEDYKVF